MDLFRLGRLEEIRLTLCPLMASIGNNRPNAISENGPSCDPDYERNGELHHVSFRL